MRRALGGTGRPYGRTGQPFQARAGFPHRRTAAFATIFGRGVFVLIFVLLAALIAVVLLLAPRGSGVRSFRPPAEERALIDRAARGDSEAAAELGRRGAAEEAALKARAAADPRAAREYLERKASELKALQWAREGLRESPGESAEQTAEVRARIERQYADVAKEVDWARGRAGQ